MLEQAEDMAAREGDSMGRTWKPASASAPPTINTGTIEAFSNKPRPVKNGGAACFQLLCLAASRRRRSRLWGGRGVSQDRVGHHGVGGGFHPLPAPL